MPAPRVPMAAMHENGQAIRPRAPAFILLHWKGTVLARTSSVLRFLSLSLILMLTACSTCVTCVKVIDTPTGAKLGNNTKLASYEGVISKLAVFVLEPQAVTAMPLTGGYGRAPTSGRAAMADTEAAFKAVFTNALNAQGLPAELASSDDPGNVAGIRIPPGSTHFLILSPMTARTQCASGCRTSVEVHAVLKDLGTNAVVWEGYLYVTEGPIFGKITNADAEQSAALVLDAFRKNKLVASR